MITLYHASPTRAHLVRFLLGELGLPHELKRLDLMKGEHKSPAYMKVNPMGQLPALVLDDGRVICECGAICLHLADQAPEKRLAPPVDSPDRAKYYHWVFFAIGTQLFALGKIAMHSMFLPPEARRPQIEEDGRNTWPHVAQVLSNELEGKPYLLGQNFSAADVMVGGSLWLANAAGVLKGHPVLERYYDRIQERPAFQKGFAD
jgi:glutathione S-transferase